MKSFRFSFVARYSSSSAYVIFSRMFLCFKTIHLTVKSASVFLSMSSLVVTIVSAVPNRPSSTKRCVSVPSRVPVSPKRYLHWCNLVIIPVRDLDLNICASSPITHPKSSKYFFGILYKDCHVDITTSLVTLRS